MSNKNFLIILFIIVLLNFVDLYFKYLSNIKKHFHDVSYKIPFIILALLILAIYLFISKKEEEKIFLIKYIVLILISSFSNLVDLIVNKGKIINYIDFHFFYNNISDILLTLIFFYFFVEIINKYKT